MTGIHMILLGPPGAGKGTIANILEKEMGLAQISTGDILRGAIQTGSELGKKAQVYMDHGDLVPDDLVIQLVEEFLHSQEFEDGYILDGFPRTLNQARALDNLLSKQGIELDEVVLVDIDEKEIIKRITGRRTCSNSECQSIYHITYNPPQSEGICDKCGSELITREDETEKVIKNRLEVYRKKTAPLIDYYQQKNILRPYTQHDSRKIAEEIKSNYP